MKKNMPKRKVKPDSNVLRREFYNDLEAGKISGLAEAVRRMRKVTKLTQPDYARLVNIAPRVLIDIERGVGNPTMKTLEKLGRPFGLIPCFQRK